MRAGSVQTLAAEAEAGGLWADLVLFLLITCVSLSSSIEMIPGI